MSDFLDNLLDRHSDAMPQIVPRLPSLFEPEIDGGGLSAAVCDSHVHEMEEPAAPRPPEVVGPTVADAVTDPVGYEAEAALLVPVNLERPSAKAMLNEPDLSVSLPEFSDVSLHPDRDQDRVRVPRSADEPLSLPLSTTPVSFSVGSAHRTYRHTRLERQPPASAATTEKRTSAAKRMNNTISVLAHRESLEINPALTSESVVVPERDERPTRRLLTPSLIPIVPIIPSLAGPERPTSQPEPVINVTIGRIEVRAIPASAQPAQKPRSMPPVMTLDEYLRKRAEGERR